MNAKGNGYAAHAAFRLRSTKFGDFVKLPHPFCVVIKNSPLPKGKYKTSIEGPFTFSYLEETMVVENRYEITFEIK